MTVAVFLVVVRAQRLWKKRCALRNTHRMAQEVTEDERRKKLEEVRQGKRSQRQSVPDLSRTPSFLL
jgi:hypothetical protein